MSHIVEIKTQVRDRGAVESACRRLQLPVPQDGRHKLFTSEAEGLGVQLPDWRYPVVCELETGDVKFDNFGGRWGEQSHLDRFLQGYAVEKATSEARKQGHSVVEQPLNDGSIKLTINAGGTA